MQPHEAIMGRLRQIHEAGIGRDTDQGMVVMTLRGYISGDDERVIKEMADLFTEDIEETFMFENRAQAESFIQEFAEVLGEAVALRYG